MKALYLALPSLFLLQACSVLTNKNVPNCPEINKQNLCFAKLAQIAPTQKNIGLLAVESRTAKILKKAQNNELSKYIEKRKAPAIKGPNKRFYILDRHHLAASLYYSPISYEQKRILIQQIDDKSLKEQTDFLEWMKQNNYLYLKDNGKRISPKDLPSEISKLTNDSYRGLIWLAIQHKILRKPKGSGPYYEFHLAEKIRKKIDLSRVRPRVREDYLPYLEKVSNFLAP